MQFWLYYRRYNYVGSLVASLLFALIILSGCSMSSANDQPSSPVKLIPRTPIMIDDHTIRLSPTPQFSPTLGLIVSRTITSIEQASRQSDSSSTTRNTFMTLIVGIILGAGFMSVGIYLFLPKFTRRNRAITIPIVPRQSRTPSIPRSSVPFLPETVYPSESPSAQNPANRVQETNDSSAGLDIWHTFGASAIGRSHVLNQLPCQDSFATAPFVKDGAWGIAVVSDGMGTARYADKGSQFITQMAVEHFTNLIRTRGWIDRQELPTGPDWKIAAEQTLVILRRALDRFAKNNEYQLDDLKCTVIILIYSPFGLLLTHIGDGRAAYQETNGTWHAMMTPYKGEEANETCSITSRQLIIESRVIDKPVKAFVVMSDGCERYTFTCSIMDEENQKWFDPNQPFSRFLTPLVDKLSSILSFGHSSSAINQELETILTSGTKELREESDDKTMIIGVLK